MTWTQKIDQQQNALLLTFFMFVSMVLVLVRYGFTARSATFLLAPYQNQPHVLTALPQNGVQAGCDPPALSTCHDDPDQLYAAALILLCMGHAIGRQIAGLQCHVYELMKLANLLAQSLHSDSCKTPRRRKLTGKRLDAP